MLGLDMVFILIMLGLVSWFIPGVAGGTITAVVIKWAHTRLDYGRSFLIAVGWTMGMVIGGITGALLGAYLNEMRSLLGNFNYRLPWIIEFAVTGMITALIGSWITYKILESASEVVTE